MNDRFRPADYQVNVIYRCDSCGQEIEQVSIYGVINCHCGGRLVQVGESYPSDPYEWDEERDPDGQWHRRW